MNRRRFLGFAAVGLGAAVAGRVVSVQSSKPKGELWDWASANPAPIPRAVFVNGRECEMCFACHTGEGWADYYKTNGHHSNGFPRIVKGPDGDPILERRYGRVDVREV